MTISNTDTVRATDAPYDIFTGLRTLDLTTSNATISLVAGVYDALHDAASGRAVLSLTGTTASMPPATGAAEVTGFVCPVGAVVTFVVTATTTLNAKMSTGTATLYLMRKAYS